MSNDELFSLYIVGTQKSGTSSLYQWLSQHPDILAPQEFKDFPLYSGELTNFEKRLRRIRKISDAYKKKYTKKHILLGAEDNLTFSDHGIEKLAEECPNCKIVYLIRQPDERCYSAWRYSRERGLETRSFITAIKDELNDIVISKDTFKGMQMNYLAHSRYVDELKKLRTYFSEDQIIIFSFELLKENPKLLMNKIAFKLGIPKLKNWDFKKVNQTSSSYKSSLLNKLLFNNRNNLFYRSIRWVFPWSIRSKFRLILRDFNRSDIPVIVEKPNVDAVAMIKRTLQAEFVMHKKIRQNENLNIQNEKI